ncbi:MAG: alpha-glucosidase/alpha-galactosidase, partial [Clostridia bacterium]|nr:alpha-glucosidase/alpha-galactosidase [Clostridia bacterium]
MKKFAFIGAGSLQFTSTCVKDLLHFDAFRPCEIRLMDTNEEHLKMITKVVERTAKEMDCPECVIIPTTDRVEALKDADGVLVTVFNGDVDVWRHEIEIPKKYGIDVNVGDTRNVAGIFRALRN